MIEKPQAISSVDIESALEKMGWTGIYAAGPYKVLSNPNSEERVIINPSGQH